MKWLNSDALTATATTRWTIPGWRVIACASTQTSLFHKLVKEIFSDGGWLFKQLH
ncbi:hypothetical protein TTRE_0000211301 [Trichuris trichiura]|uniref:Uncharacterized protein n=1 Tax=Trichuris trichiura TaxID=36087 RepID=A0A077Z1A5_TRITR|nr:hypothetical protein TTRE_0000211301 [Trichuris trichiura]